MWGGSDRLVQCLTKNHHQIRVKAEILVDGKVELTIKGATMVDPFTGSKAGLVDGGVKVARTQVRREGDLRITDLSAVPGSLSVRDASDLFAPLRTEFRLYRGYEYWNATEYERISGSGIEYWPIGTFIINKAPMTWPTIDLHGFDRLWNLRGRFQRPWVVKNGTPNMEELERLIRSIIPPAQVSLDLPVSDSKTGALVWEQQDDQLTRAHDLALADGRVLYSDPMGTIRAVDEPFIDPSQVVWTFAPGRFNIGANPSREIDAIDAENVVIATGESDGTTPPVSGRAVDDNPASFTYIGKTPQIARFYSSPLLRTQAQCVAAARVLLMRELGVSDSVVVPTIPIPGLESGDIIRVEDSKTRTNDLLIADVFNIPLRASGAMSIECRTQRI